MNYQTIILKLFYLITNIFLIQAARHKHYRNHQYDQYPQLPEITFDHLGNCYVETVHLRGHCVRYQECQSAVKAWQKSQKQPFSCYFTTYDNFVCCPEAFVKVKYQPPAIPYYPYYDPSFASAATFTNQLPTQEQRISEKECSSIYNNHGNQHRRRQHHRSRRSVNSTKPEVELEDSSEAVQEEFIEKVELAQTQAVGGVQTHRNEFPYMCALGWRKSSSKRAETDYNCGCVLIARKYVLTAAHCATLGGESPSVVRLGGVDLDERRAEMIKVQRVIQHPEYDTQFAYNDIAVIKLERGSRYTPACLWPHVGLPQQTLTAIGYGQTKFAGPSSNTLLKVFLNVLTNENCNTYYDKLDKLKNGVNQGQICAGDPEGKMDTCQGDSGGPLLMKESKYNIQVPYVVGLTSFGEGCATKVPSVYTRISYFIDWIEEIVWKV